MLARSRASGVTRAQREAASGGADGAASPRAADGAASEEEEASESSCWRRALQDAGKAIYSDGTLKEPYLVKASALQAMERWGEAVGVLEQCIRTPEHNRDVSARAAATHAPPVGAVH